MSGILTTIRWLSIFTGALSLFYLGHAWFEFGLGEVFTRVYAWYAGILHPVVELLKPVAQWLVGLLGWSLPVWWKDVMVLYFTMGGATAKGRNWSEDPGMHGGIDVATREEVEPRPATGWSRREPGIAWALLRFFVWPAVWLFEFTRERELPTRAIFGGYIGTSLVEFLRILTGALIFAGLNAGLG